MRKAVESIRRIPEINHNRKVMLSLFVVFLGLVLGLVAKVTDSVSVIGEIGTGLGLWVFIVTSISAFSHTPRYGNAECPPVFLVLAFLILLIWTNRIGIFPESVFYGLADCIAAIPNWRVLCLAFPRQGLDS